MQLLRDNLTLWTSSDGGEPEPAPAGGEPARETEKPTPGREDKPETTTAPAETATLESHPASHQASTPTAPPAAAPET